MQDLSLIRGKLSPACLRWATQTIAVVNQLFSVNVFVGSDGVKDQRFGGNVIPFWNAALLTDLKQQAKRTGQASRAQSRKFAGQRLAFAMAVRILAEQIDFLLDQMFQVAVLLGLVQEFRSEAGAINSEEPLAASGGEHVA